MNSIKIEFENSPIRDLPLESIDKVSFICSIFKVYSLARIRFRDTAKRYFNNIKGGIPVNFIFESGSNRYVNKMMVLSFEKESSPGGDATDIIEMTLISSIYFDKTQNTASYDGSVGIIIETIMSEFFKNTVTKYEGTSTDDFPRRRYQTSERTLDFMKRILKYGIQGKKPVYLFTDAKGVLKLRGISEMSNSSPKCTARSVLSEKLGSVGTHNTSDKNIVMYDFHSIFNGKKACSKINSVFSVRNFRFSEGTESSYTYIGPELRNNQIETGVPPKTRFYGWNLAPMDAYAIAARDSFEDTYDTCSFLATFMGFDVDNLELGGTLDIELPYNPGTTRDSSGDEANLGEGRYLITELRFEGDGNSLQTIATLVQVAC